VLLLFNDIDRIFVHCDDDVMLLRRLKRDVMTRGRTIEGVLKSYNRFVKFSYMEFIKPVIIEQINAILI
jgi:uridine kinase